MTPMEIEKILRAVASGKLTISAALDRLRALPFEDLGYARVDHHRELRRGFPEVVFGEGKTVAQCAAIASRIARAGQTVLVTRATKAQFDAVRRAHARAEWHEAARMIVIRSEAQARKPGGAAPGETMKAQVNRRPADAPSAAGHEEVLVISAGTSDIPVAEEAALTAEVLGCATGRCYDVGVAGLHRLLDIRERLEAARAIVVVAGMEGALPSVVAGLVRAPVIGVPTSVGYGAALGGLTALFGMLTSCAGGLTVVNIDNGFGAGVAAAQIVRR